MSIVLIIEDEEPLARMMAAFLLEAGYMVATADSAQKALARLETITPDVIVFNTVIMDDAKRLMNQQIRKLAPDAKILDVSLEKNRVFRQILRKSPSREGAGLSHDGAGLSHDGTGLGRDGAGLSHDGAGLSHDGTGLGRDGAGLSHDGASDAAAPESTSADAYLQLPFEADALLKGVRELLLVVDPDAPAPTG